MKLSRAFVATLLLGLLVSCSSLNMPSVTDEPTNSTIEGKIIWHDLLSDTPVESKLFYSELFGWQFEDVELKTGLFQSINYTLIRHNGKLIGGMVDQTRLETKEDISQWVVLLSVKDIDAAVASFIAQNGTVFASPTDLADRGKIAIVADPQGALLGLLQTKDGDPLDEQEVDVGGFLWDEIWTSDVSKTTQFYTRIVQYDAEDHIINKEDNSKHNYRLLKTNNIPRAGVLTNPVEGLSPIWVSYIRVKNAESLDAIVARVEELGGAILLAPQSRAIGGRVALIAGPSGAGIALQTWPDKSKITE